MLFVKGFDAGEPIVYLSTEPASPTPPVLERSTYVPALDKAAYIGGDDFLGSSRERLFGFVNGQAGASNKNSQGFAHLVMDGHACEDASAGNSALIEPCATGVTCSTCLATSRPWRTPATLTPTAPCGTRNSVSGPTRRSSKARYRQIDEHVVFNLAATRPDLLTGPGGAPYGATGLTLTVR